MRDDFKPGYPCSLPFAYRDTKRSTENKPGDTVPSDRAGRCYFCDTPIEPGRGGSRATRSGRWVVFC